MYQHLRSYFYVIAILGSILLAGNTQAEDEVDKASAAVTSILFEFNADEFTTYIIKDDGRVDITFARNTPDELYGNILNKLQTHPDIKGVLAGRGGPACPLF